jgi:AcrR family transcriptional regulator
MNLTPPGSSPHHPRTVPKAAYHHGDLRQALLQAAEALLAERGPDGFSLREVARRIGVSNAAPAHHFADAAALLTELAATGFDRLSAAIAEAIEGVQDPTERLLRMGEAYVARAVAAPAMLRLMFHSDRVDRSAPRLQQAGDVAYGALNDAVAALSAPGSDTYPDIAFAWSVVHGFAVLLIERQLVKDPRFGDWQARLADILVRLAQGLGPHAVADVTRITQPR